MNANTQQLIDSLKAKGYQVYGPEELDSYVYFTDGKRIGYAQYDRVQGVKYSTVHKPHSQIGTGFRADSAEEALAHVPKWAHMSDWSFVVKYADLDTFRKEHWQPLVPYTVTDVTLSAPQGAPTTKE